MALNVFWHPNMLEHSAGIGHPESPDRVETVVAGIMDWAESKDVSWQEVDQVDESLLRITHDPTHVDLIRKLSERGGGQIDGDTALNSHSFDAASRAANAAVLAAECALLEGAAFAAVRPPGHHATYDRAMGFCFFNNVVVAALWAKNVPNLQRILIVDWDVHHGNGTQALVESDACVRYVSMHQWPFYPGTGRKEDCGVGNVFNVPLPPGLPRENYVKSLNDAVDTATRGWKPELILISAGFDGMAGDPLGGFTLEPEDYATWLADWKSLGAPIASVLEGGYDPKRITQAVLAHLEALAC